MMKLAKAGTAQNRKVYARHGVGAEMFGVSYAALDKLAKGYRQQSGLAAPLWASGNHDARVLATMIADASLVQRSTLTAWARDLDNYVVTDAFSKLVAHSPHGGALAKSWMDDGREWIARAGWSVLTIHLMDRNRQFQTNDLEQLVGRIEREIHVAPNRVRDAMNSALIAIGLRDKHLESIALAAAERIGKVEVDHGKTNCKTPDAAGYIRRAVSRQKAPKSLKRQKK